jgi:hypothetical protein
MKLFVFLLDLINYTVSYGKVMAYNVCLYKCNRNLLQNTSLQGGYIAGTMVSALYWARWKQTFIWLISHFKLVRLNVI